MAIFNLTTSGNQFLNFSASTDTWLVGKTEVQFNTVAFDIPNLQTGWGNIQSGQPPHWVLDPKLGEPATQPTSEYRRGFQIHVWITGYGWVQWASIASGSTKGFEEIAEKIWEQKDDHSGQLPVLQNKGSRPIKIGKGNTRVPMFDLIGWAKKSEIPDFIKSLSGHQAPQSLVKANDAAPEPEIDINF
jgi:hypothetical protein